MLWGTRNGRDVVMRRLFFGFRFFSLKLIVKRYVFVARFFRFSRGDRGTRMNVVLTGHDEFGLRAPFNLLTKGQNLTLQTFIERTKIVTVVVENAE